jgi:hypothetical protein
MIAAEGGTDGTKAVASGADTAALSGAVGVLGRGR